MCAETRYGGIKVNRRNFLKNQSSRHVDAIQVMHPAQMRANLTRY